MDPSKMDYVIYNNGDFPYDGVPRKTEIKILEGVTLNGRPVYMDRDFMDDGELVG